MKRTLIICQLLILVSIVVNIIIAYLFRTKNKNLRFLVKIPKLSLIQIIISELITIKIKYPNRTTDNIYVNLNLAIYALAESTLIVLFLINNYRLKKEKITIFFLSLFSILFFLIDNILINKNVGLSIKYFHIVFGFFLEIGIIILIISSIKGKSIDELINDNKTIALLGIFISYILIWPTNIIQALIFKNPQQYYEYFFVANSIGYFIFFSFLSISLYVSRKH